MGDIETGNARNGLQADANGHAARGFLKPGAATLAALAGATGQQTLPHAVKQYFARWKGHGAKAPPPAGCKMVALCWIGAFLALLASVGFDHWINQHWNLPLLLASFGTNAVLIFGLHELEAAQPRAALGGTAVSILVGLFWRTLLGEVAWLAIPLSVATAIAAMQLTSTMHPPGGATALLLAAMAPTNTLLPVGAAAAARAPHIWGMAPNLQHAFLLRFTDGCKLALATLIGHVTMLLVALVVNNFEPDKPYPTHWW